MYVNYETGEYSTTDTNKVDLTGWGYFIPIPVAWILKLPIVKRIGISFSIWAKNAILARLGKLVPGGGLRAHELAGGHLIDRHVGKTAQQLLQRLRDQPRITGASTFTNGKSAEIAVTATLNANKAAIKSFISGNRSQIIINHTFNKPVGISVMRGSSTVSPASSVKLILRRDSSLSTGYRIHTGFPTL